MANRIKVANANAIEPLRQRGLSCRRIAEILGIDRGTVGRYVRRVEQGANAATLSAGNCSPKSLCEPYREAIREKVDQG